MTVSTLPSSDLTLAGPRLWIDEEGLHKRRAAITGSPLAPVLEKWTAQAAALLHEEFSPATDPAFSTEDTEDRLDLLTTAHLATGDARFARRAVKLAHAFMNRADHGKDLGKALVAYWGALALDTCGAAADPADTRALAKRLGELARSFSEISNGNPDNPFNNWWAVTHSAKGLAALAALPYDPSLRSVYDDAAARIRFYISNYGEAGHCYEGTGYGLYAFSYWGPFALAARHAGGIDITDQCLGVPNMAALLAALTVALPQEPAGRGLEPTPGASGRRIFWNDDGGNSPPPGLTLLLMGLARAADRPALRAFFDRLNGPEGDQTWSIADRKTLWTFLLYPLDVAPAEPDESLPCHIFDYRTGLVLFRNGYRDQRDCVFGAYAKNWHGGGHAHDDAGSFRFIGLGGEWAQNGGQAKFGPENQCAILVDDRQRPANYPHVPGKLLHTEAFPEGLGGRVSLRLDRTYAVSRLDRHFLVAYAAAHTGVPALIAVHDRLWDEHAREWAWTLCMGPHTRFEKGSDDRTFFLRSDRTPAYLKGTFLAPAEFRLEEREGPPSQRTFANGKHTEYPGVRHLRATCTGHQTEFLVILTLQEGPAPEWKTALVDGVATAVSSHLSVGLRMSRWHEGPLFLEKRSSHPSP
jgi:hypothetical protein